MRDPNSTLSRSYEDPAVREDLRSGILAILRGELSDAEWVADNSQDPHALAMAAIRFGAFALVDFLHYDGATRLVLGMKVHG